MGGAGSKELGRRAVGQGGWMGMEGGFRRRNTGSVYGVLYLFFLCMCHLCAGHMQQRRFERGWHGMVWYEDGGILTCSLDVEIG